jgi:site-specific DNA-methyltransferase (adenine-specific)
MNTKEEAAAVWLDVDQLKPWADNPRLNSSAVEAVADSITRFGFASPIVARQEDHMIIAGHTRFQAALKLGYEQVPVRLLDLTADQARLLALADNKIGEIAQWDESKLNEVIFSMNEDGLDLDNLGFSEEELDHILGDNEPDLPLVDEGENEALDEIPEEIPAKTLEGEIVNLDNHVLHCGDCVEVMRSFEDNSIDGCVTDPPYGIGFMGKNWDCSVPGEDFANELFRILKPGAHGILFAATRTIHRLTSILEDAGFEVRDQIGWLQWQGFPKSLNISKAFDKDAGAEREIIGTRKTGIGTGKGSVPMMGDGNRDLTAPSTEEAKTWNGWGTALKPSIEPAVLIRKPLDGTVIENIRRWGVGALNIDATRIAYGDPAWPVSTGYNPDAIQRQSKEAFINFGGAKPGHQQPTFHEKGRWPANIYVCPKPARSEKEAGCDDLDSMSGAQAVNRKEGSAGMNNPRAGAGRTATTVKNFHPTVKPSKLMKWLGTLISPPGSNIIEPFGGSGSTLIGMANLDCSLIVIEKEPKYCDIIRARYTSVSRSKDE